MIISYISAEPIRPQQASETHVKEIAKQLSRLGHQVHIYSSETRGPYERTFFVRRIVGAFGLWANVFRVIRQTDVIYARAHPLNAPIAFLAWLMGIPVVHEINGFHGDVAITHRWLSKLVWLIAALQRYQYRRAYALIAVTQGLADWLKDEAPGVPVEHVPNGVNIEIFHSGQPPVRPVEQDFAMFFGSLTRWHGIEVTLAAVESKSWPTGLDLVLVGDGQLSELAQKAAERNPRIHVLPGVPQNMLASYCNAAALGLVPINTVGARSRYGFSPLKVFEMLACGLQLVASDFPDHATLIRSLNAGRLVPADDPEALAVAVAQLRANPIAKETMARAAAEIHRNHCWANRAAQIEKILLRAARSTP